MKSLRSISLIRFFVLFFCCFFSVSAWSQARDVYQFEIISGEVSVQSVFCLPEFCETQTAQLSGRFQGFLPGGGTQLFFPSSALVTTPNLDFQLPEDPNEDSGGTSREVKFSFNGRMLKVEGLINSSAFDGPITRYAFSAEVVAPGGKEVTFFTARPDFRKCVSPLCGGYFVKQVNRRFTQCADGSRQRECYVAELNVPGGVQPFEQSFDNNKPLLVAGHIEPKVFPTFGNLGQLNAEFVQYSASNRTARGAFFATKNNGIVCITSPCFSFDQIRLNSQREKTLSRVTFDRSGADEKAIDKAQTIMAEGGYIYASGYNRRYKGFAGIGKEFVITQFYLPAARPDIVLCEEGYTFSDGACRTPHGCAFPQIELTGVGGAGMIDPITGEVTASITKSCIDSCDDPAFLSGPGQCQIFFP